MPRKAIILVALVLLGGTVSPLGAQGVDSLRQRFRLPYPPTFDVAARGSAVAPGITIGTPTGLGADFGDAFIGVAYQARTRREDGPDGAVAAGFGLGDARRLVGLEVTITSFGTVNSCCRGGISTKLHRLVGDDASVAVGVENLGRWRWNAPVREVTTDAGTSVYAVGTKIFHLRGLPGDPFSMVAVSLGVGNGRFRSEDDILADEETVNVFGSVSLRALEQASIIADWTGQDLIGGVSIVPFDDVPLFITPAFADLTTDPRFILGVGYGFNYASFF